jgi:fatty acid desaturase
MAALAAALYLIAHAEPTARQLFAIGATFGYSINTFSATVGHELLHRKSAAARLCSDILYTVMLYPQFPAVHLASHHRWAGSDRDCQTPRAGQQIYPYLHRALVGGLRTASTGKAAVLDPHLRARVAACVLCMAALALADALQEMIFLVVQGAFSFIQVETFNYIQHYKHVRSPSKDGDQPSALANQDLNFVSRCLLLNLPLHASHHSHQSLPYFDLGPIPCAPS